MNLKEVFKKEYAKFESAINRIPNDLVIWEKELKKLKGKKDKRSKAIFLNYYYHLAYYTGKLMAYLMVIDTFYEGKIYLLPIAKKYIGRLFNAVKTEKGITKPSIQKYEK